MPLNKGHVGGCSLKDFAKILRANGFDIFCEISGAFRRFVVHQRLGDFDPARTHWAFALGRVDALFCNKLERRRAARIGACCALRGDRAARAHGCFQIIAVDFCVAPVCTQVSAHIALSLSGLHSGAQMGDGVAAAAAFVFF